MDKDTKEMLGRVLLYDILILVLAFIGSILFFDKYAVVVIVGVLMAGINFLLNGVITSYTMSVTGKKGFYIVGAMVRIMITVGVAVLIADNNINNLVAFLIGYSLHYIAVLFYGATRGIKKERK